VDFLIIDAFFIWYKPIGLYIIGFFRAYDCRGDDQSRDEISANFSFTGVENESNHRERLIPFALPLMKQALTSDSQQSHLWFKISTTLLTYWHRPSHVKLECTSMTCLRTPASFRNVFTSDAIWGNVFCCAGKRRVWTCWNSTSTQNTPCQDRL
jgi:hypothetical protein